MQGGRYRVGSTGGVGLVVEQGNGWLVVGLGWWGWRYGDRSGEVLKAGVIGTEVVGIAVARAGLLGLGWSG